MTKKQDQNTENPNMWNVCFWCSALGPAPSHFLSPGPHNNRTLKPSTPENRTSLLHHVLNHVLKCSFLQCFSNINQICPQNRPLTKMITLHNAQNKTGCFRNGLLWKMKTFMLTKTHNWKNEKNKIKKRVLKDKKKQETRKNKNNWWKETFQMLSVCRETNTKKQGKKKQQKTRKEKINKKARKKHKKQETR